MAEQDTHAPRRIGTLLISGFLLLVLGLQTMTALGITGGRLRPPPYLWPFIDYPMYVEARYEGDLINVFSVFATFADGEEREIDHVDMGLEYWIFEREVRGNLKVGDVEHLRSFVRRHEERSGRRPIAYRIDNHPWVLTRDGLVRGERFVVNEVRFDVDPGDGS